MYLRAAFQTGGAYEIVYQRDGDPETSSAPGTIPCPLFVLRDDPCDCASLPLTTLFAVMSTSMEISQLYFMAVRRMSLREAPDVANQVEDPTPDENPVETVHRLVEKALNDGYISKCPDCGSAYIKNDACMHMTCTTCATRWCYCCGRRRQGPSEDLCRGCDSVDIYIHRQPGGWDTHAIGDETVGYGALWEFLKRRIAFLVRRVKEEVPANDWQEFRQSYPDILVDVPTPQRSIPWDQLDNATPPVFGSSVEDDMLWIPARQETAPLTVQVEPEDPPFQSWREILASKGGILWLLGVALAVLLLVLRWTVSDYFLLRLVGDFLISVLAFFGFRCFLLWWPDFCVQEPRHPLVRQNFGYRQFSGTPQEAPYLSSTGRWHAIRRQYVSFLVGTIALGSFLVGSANQVGDLGTTCRIIGSILLSFTATGFCLLYATVSCRSPPPSSEAQESSAMCARFLTTPAIQVGFFSLGVGLTTAKSQSAKQAGTVLLSVGLASLVATLFPRIIRPPPLWQDLDPGVCLQNYLFFVGVTLGSLLVWLGRTEDSSGLRKTGTGLLLLVLPGAALSFLFSRRAAA